MPMIDVCAPDSLFPVHSTPAPSSELIHAVLRAEGVASPGPFHLNNTAAFFTGCLEVQRRLEEANTRGRFAYKF